MRWKDWKKFPEIDDLRIRALRSLVFEKVAEDLDSLGWSPEYTLSRIKESKTLPGARIILFFIQRNNEWSHWEGVKSYLIEKYGYAESTVENVGFSAAQALCEFKDEETLRLKPEVYERAIEILENEQLAMELSERFTYIVDEWLESHGYYEDDEEVDEEDSESSIRLVLGSGERLRVTVEVEVIIKSIRFHAD